MASASCTEVMTLPLICLSPMGQTETQAPQAVQAEPGKKVPVSSIPVSSGLPDVFCPAAAPNGQTSIHFPHRMQELRLNMS